jgi:hypothetical protein
MVYWIDPEATALTWWAVRFTGRLYVPWSSIRVGVWHDDGFYLRLCSIDTGDSWWVYIWGYRLVGNGMCTGAPGVYDIEIGFWQANGPFMLVFIIGPDGGNEAYIPTIDGAWYCPNFRWAGTQQGTCGASWSFVPASSSVPHFRGTNYTPGSTDGGGTPQP